MTEQELTAWAAAQRLMFPKGSLPGDRARAVQALLSQRDALQSQLAHLHFAVNEYFSYSPSRRDSKMGSGIDAVMRASFDTLARVSHD